jgi:hypothetical protein
MSEQIFVTNTNKDDHVDRYDGEEYVFPANERVMIPFDAAVHMFGHNMKDKTETLVRLGWAMTYDPAKKQFVEDPEGPKRLARFVFDEAVMVSKSSLEQKLAQSAKAQSHAP